MKKYKIDLEEDHLIILSDLLYRISESDILNDFIVDKAELQAVWHLAWILERNTPDILSNNYLEALKKARNRYRHKEWFTKIN